LNSEKFSSIFSISFHYSTYLSSIFSISFHNSTYFSSSFFLSFHYSTYYSSIFSKSFHYLIYLSSILSIYLYSTYFSLMEENKLNSKNIWKMGKKVGWIVKWYGKNGRK
jgi:hypothetical protein